MTDDEKWRAILDNDRRCDGQFFYGVRSTGIFCRPSCASRPPRRENVIFFDSAAKAAARGFRPCKRCAPERPDGDPAAALAAEARAVIDRTVIDRAAIDRAAIDPGVSRRDALRAQLNALGVSRRHLTEVFEQRYGLSPEQYVAQVRFDRAKALLEAGSSVTDVAFAVGMESAAAFSTFFKKQSGCTPSEYAARRAEEQPCRFIDTPLGPMRIREDLRGISALQFADGGTKPAGRGVKGRFLADAEAQLSEYFAGARRAFQLPLSVRGSEFQRRVWDALREIPYGETRSYQAVAAAIGNPRAARAVGLANNRNPVLILIPCHRVIGKAGSPVGYAGGIERKLRLLALERAGQGPL